METTNINKILDIAYSEYDLRQIRSEIFELLAKIQNLENFASFLEIGLHQGGTHFLFKSLQAPGGISVAVDIPPNSARTKRLKDLGSTIIEKNSLLQSTVDEVSAVLGETRVDLLFIDGDHSYDGVKLDYENYKKFVRPGGLIVFHDIVDSPKHRAEGSFVALFWKELKEQKNNNVFEITAGHYNCGIGIVVNEEN